MKKILALTCAMAFTSMVYSAENFGILLINTETFLEEGESLGNFLILTNPVETWENFAHKIQNKVPNFDLKKLIYDGEDFYKPEKRNTTLNQADIFNVDKVRAIFGLPGEHIKGPDE